MDDQDRSALFNDLKNFSQRKLKKVETKVVTASGEQLVEKRGAKGLQVLSGDVAKNQKAEPERKLDLQVGLILPGFIIGSQDVAHDKSSLDSYGVTHILNLDLDIENKFEDDYNYKNVKMQDRPDFELDKVLEDCFDFIDDGRHYGNVLVHCSGTIGLSRSTTICIAYLMNKEKQKFDEAFNNVKEARSFVKPNEGFIKQLKDYEVKLRGAQAVKDSGIDDPFALRKKQEIEQEKAMVAGAASVKNRMKMFGATLDTGAASRSKSVSPSPAAKSASPAASPAVNKWSSSSQQRDPSSASMSKSMTPEPRKSWRDSSSATTTSDNKRQPDWRSPANTRNQGPPPPPPPMPTASLHGNDKSVKPLTSSSSNYSNKSNLPPAPPPPPPASLLGSSDTKPARPSPGHHHSSSSSANERKPSISSASESSDGGQRMVFGRVRPPAMKIKGGLSIERQDSTGEQNTKNTKTGSTRTSTQSLNIDSSYANTNGTNAFGMPSSSSIYHHQHQQQAYQQDQRLNNGSTHRLDQRCASPLVLMNNVSPQLMSSQSSSPNVASSDQRENPFKYWQQHVAATTSTGNNRTTEPIGQAPKRTTSLGPRRPPLGDALQKSPFIHSTNEINGNFNQQQQQQTTTATRGLQRHFNRAANELQSSLTELNNLIEAQATPKIKAPNKPPAYMSYISSTTSSKATTPSEVRVVHHDPSSEASSPQNDDEVLPRWQWQQDLSEWKSSSSVNDLRSMFEAPQRLNLLPPLSSSSVSDRPPLSASPSVMKKSPWQRSEANTFSGSDYTIRRTTSSSTSGRPILRNPYRSQY